MAGRTRHTNIARQPNGQPSRAGQNRVEMSTGRREFVLIRRALIDPLWGTQVGQMVKDGSIGLRDFDAGVSYVRVVSDYARAIGCPMRDAKAIDFSAVHGKSLVSIDGMAERDQKAVKSYNSLRDALIIHGHKVDVLNDVLVSHKSIGGHINWLDIVAALKFMNGYFSR